MATLTVAATGVGSTSNWTLAAGASKQVAVNAPDDDATSYVNSGTTINTVQQFTGDTSTLPAGSIVTQVDITYRVLRGGANNATFTVGYTFTPNGGGSQTGTSGAITSTASWSGGTYSHSGLSAIWGSAFVFNIQNTQARDVRCSTLYAVITYTPPSVAVMASLYRQRRA